MLSNSLKANMLLQGSSDVRGTLANCEMCRNYELQLQIVQCNEEDLKAEVSKIKSSMKAIKEEVKKEQRSKNELEDKFMEEAKVTESKLKECSERLDAANRHVAELRGKSKNRVIVLRTN